MTDSRTIQANDSTAGPRRDGRWWLVPVLAYLLCLAVQLPAVLMADGPVIFGDELLYRQFAEDVTNGTYRDPHYPPLYPLVISPALALSEFYRPMLFINAFVGAGVVIPTWFIATRLVGKSYSTIAVVIAATLPYHISYVRLLMSENLFYTLMLFALLAMLRYVERPTLARAAGLGLLGGACYLARHLGITVAAAGAIAVIMPHVTSRTTSYLPSLATPRMMRHGFAFTVGLGLVYGPWIAITFSKFSIKKALGFHIGAGGADEATVGALFQWLTYYGSYLLVLGLPLLPIILLSIRYWPRISRSERNFFFLALTLGGLQLIAAIRHSWLGYPDFGKIHGRYIIYISIPIIIWALIVLRHGVRDQGFPYQLASRIPMAAVLTIAAHSILRSSDAITWTNSPDAAALLTVGSMPLALLLFGGMWFAIRCLHITQRSLIPIVGISAVTYTIVSSLLFSSLGIPIEGIQDRSIHAREIAAALTRFDGAPADQLSLAYALPLGKSALRQGLTFWSEDLKGVTLQAVRSSNAPLGDREVDLVALRASHALDLPSDPLHEYSVRRSRFVVVEAKTLESRGKPPTIARFTHPQLPVTEDDGTIRIRLHGTNFSRFSVGVAEGTLVETKYRSPTELVVLLDAHLLREQGRLKVSVLDYLTGRSNSFSIFWSSRSE